jgi:hypothetical protein
MVLFKIIFGFNNYLPGASVIAAEIVKLYVMAT